MLNGIASALSTWALRTFATASGSEEFDAGPHKAPFPTPSAASYGSSGNGSGPNTASRLRPSLETMARKDLWPTPSASDPSGSRSLPPGTRATGMTPDGRKKQVGLLQRVRGERLGRWPTPHGFGLDGHGNELGQAVKVAEGATDAPGAIRDYAERFPTPKAAGSGPDYARTDREGSGGDDLATAVARRAWPTPMASDAKWRSTPATSARRMAEGRHAPSLNDAVMVGQQQGPAEPLEDHPRLWPTPRASEWKGTGPIGSKSHDYRVEKGYLDATVQARTGESGPLNPDWVEWLMGFPIGWTDLEVDEPLVLEGEPWPAEPMIPRMRRDVPRRAARLKQLGNAVVPKNAELVGWRLRQLLEEVGPE